MKKIGLMFLLLAVIGSCSYEKGSGKIITQDRTSGTFTGVNVSGAFKTEIRNGAAAKVMIEADDNLLQYINVKVVSGELRVSLDKVSVNDAHLKAYITAPEIDNIKASAAADIIVKDVLTSATALNLEASSGAEVKGSFDSPEIKGNVSSGGSMTLSGRTKDFHAASSSGSTLSAGKLLSENSYVNASSGGTAQVNASVSIDAEASSGGSITYQGAASTVKKSESSGGVVKKD